MNPRFNIVDKPGLVELIHNKVARKDHVEEEKISNETPISREAFNSLVSRRDVRKVTTQQGTKVEFSDDLTVGKLTEMIYPTRKSIPRTGKK